ncbi:Cys-tRNA(Pro) deacylase [Bacillaceae bacterium Marseille-Q3522]|nr:Cys-tRNA(Pro) deacylase [Bacillaceae bacterium Marseille-Q3522]
MSKHVKTNAMRLLDQRNISYQILTYELTDGRIDGLSVAEKIQRVPSMVFKTLVTRGTSGEIAVFVVPVESELDLKKAARTAGEKKIEMVAVKEIEKLTGYIRGGCSPIGMKKHYKTFIDESAFQHETIIVSGGKRGVQIEIAPEDLQKIVTV